VKNGRFSSKVAGIRGASAIPFVMALVFTPLRLPTPRATARAARLSYNSLASEKPIIFSAAESSRDGASPTYGRTVPIVCFAKQTDVLRLAWIAPKL
jgi:hypothetical protein